MKINFQPYIQKDLYISIFNKSFFLNNALTTFSLIISTIMDRTDLILIKTIKIRLLLMNTVQQTENGGIKTDNVMMKLFYCEQA